MSHHPILADAAPDDDWDEGPAGKLMWLSVFYRVKPDTIAAKVGSRSHLYAVINGERGMSDEMRADIADAVGFPVEAWDWSLERFDQWIRRNYPTFKGKFNPTQVA